jgi:hypothetical protein
VSVEQRIECGRGCTAVYSGTWYSWWRRRWEEVVLHVFGCIYMGMGWWSGFVK